MDVFVALLNTHTHMSVFELRQVLCMVLGYTHNISTTKRAIDVYGVPYGYSHAHVGIRAMPALMRNIYAPTLVTTSVSAPVKHMSRAQTGIPAKPYRLVFQKIP
ncbi:hypothetical protein Tco_1059218 [Tanacetum coccineum]